MGHKLTLNCHLIKLMPSERRELYPYRIQIAEILSHLVKSDLVDL
jgi:hypothetical protein